MLIELLLAVGPFPTLKFFDAIGLHGSEMEIQWPCAGGVFTVKALAYSSGVGTDGGVTQRVDLRTRPPKFAF